MAKFAASYASLLGRHRGQGRRAGRPLMLRTLRQSLAHLVDLHRDGRRHPARLAGARRRRAQLKPLSTVFLRMIKSVVVPIIFGTLVIGIAGPRRRPQAHRPAGGQVDRLLLAHDAVALAIGLIAVNITRPASGVILPPPDPNAPIPKAAPTTFGGFLEHIVPRASSRRRRNNEVLQVVFWATLFAHRAHPGAGPAQGGDARVLRRADRGDVQVRRASS